jgi:hypothetical protein
MMCCGMAVKRMGMLGVSVREMKVPTVKVERVTLIGRGRQKMACICIKHMKLIAIYFF